MRKAVVFPPSGTAAAQRPQQSTSTALAEGGCGMGQLGAGLHRHAPSLAQKRLHQLLVRGGSPLLSSSPPLTTGPFISAVRYCNEIACVTIKRLYFVLLALFGFEARLGFFFLVRIVLDVLNPSAPLWR